MTETIYKELKVEEYNKLSQIDREKHCNWIIKKQKYYTLLYDSYIFLAIVIFTIFCLYLVNEVK